MKEPIQPNQLITGHIFQCGEEACELVLIRIDWKDIRWCEMYNESFNEVHKPLPITQDHFKKNGFKKDEENLWLDFEDGQYLEIISARDGFYPILIQSPELSCDAEQRVNMKRINYFHELQTLVFVLTGNWIDKV